MIGCPADELAPDPEGLRICILRGVWPVLCSAQSADLIQRLCEIGLICGAVLFRKFPLDLERLVQGLARVVETSFPSQQFGQPIENPGNEWKMDGWFFR